MTAQPGWLVVGGTGLLGWSLCRDAAARGTPVEAVFSRHPPDGDAPGVTGVRADVARPGAARDLLDRSPAGVVVYAAGLTDVDGCERDEALALRLHAEVPAEFARLCRRSGRRFVAISTDHLWDGRTAFVEEDEPVRPLNAYARTKAAGEAAVRAEMPDALILRTNFFGRGPAWRRSLSDWMLGELRAGRPLRAFADAHFTPIGLPLLCGTIRDAVATGLVGTFHAAGADRVSKLAFALRLARLAGLPEDLVREGSVADARLAAPRPRDMSLSTAKLARALGRPAPSLDDSLDAVLSAAGRPH